MRRPLHEIIAIVAKATGITVADIYGRSRYREVSLPRHLAAYFCRTVGEASFPYIGHKLGGRDHTTIINSVRVIEAERQRPGSPIALACAAIEAKLKTTA